MREGVVIDFVPTVPDECADQQQKGTLRLVEVGNHPPHDVILVSRGYDNLRGGVQHLLTLLVHVAEQSFQRLFRRESIVIFVWHPLRNMKK